MGASDAGAVSIQVLAPDDAEDLWPLSVEAGWNQVPADWRLMLRLGRGFGIRDAGGRWIASALMLPLGNRIAWLSMVLVTKPSRGQGLGTRLLSQCLAEAARRNLAPGLDATEFGRPIYLPLGFRDVYPLSRWHIPQAVSVSVDPVSGITVRPAKPDDRDRIAAFDRERSGFDRAAILGHLLTRAPLHARVAEAPSGALTGYCLVRDGHFATHVGPAVAEDEATGLALLANAIRCIAGPVICDVPDAHRDVRAWLAAHGGSAPRSFMRMLQGLSSGAETAERMFAISGPELA
jgi:GNAT superfamily N-acetyltransferase